MVINDPARFLPMSSEEMQALGWDRPDFVLVTGDAYIDHPSFGAALIGRLLETEGFKVAILAQPDWRSVDDFKRFGRPALGFLVTAGNMDSMVCHYTAARKIRSEDAYSPGGVAGKRPDRALMVYANAVRQAFKKMPVIIGGMEASLRRFTHYDYWSDSLRRSVLLDSKADILVYGMGERQIIEIARRMAAGEHISSLHDIRGTMYPVSQDALPADAFILADFQTKQQNPRAFAEDFYRQLQNSDPHSAKILAEAAGDRFVVQNPPAFPLDGAELDRIYELPYARAAHPAYQQAVPALQEVLFSLVSSRGCFGACSFCALTFHQGRIVSARSHQSLLREAAVISRHPDFKGYIHDVGGPTANFRAAACKKMATSGACTDRNCLFPDPCRNLQADHRDYLDLLRKIRALPGIKKVFVRSGIRFDYLLADQDSTFFEELCEHHVSGQLKVAPEHVSNAVLKMMGKPSFDVYQRFAARFKQINQRLGKKQFLVPYLVSSHPGSRLEDAVQLAEYLRDQGIQPQQVQDFYPTPGSLSTCMYYSGIDPRSMKAVYVPKGGREKRMQRALLQYRKKENQAIVREALVKAGRPDLIGNGPKCLVPAGDGGQKNRFRTPRHKSRR